MLAHEQASGMRVDGTPADPSLTVAAVARRLGVAPATLRTWDRRYGLGPSEHLAGSHRRYSAADVSRLLTMRRLTLEGVAPSEAARTALATPTGHAGVPAGGPSVAEIMDAYSDAVPMAADPAALVVAARHFDNAAVRWMLARVHPRDVLLWWADLVEPALTRMQEGAALERPGESAVRVLEAAAFAELRSRAAAATARSEGQAGTGAVLAIPSGPFPDLLVHVLATGLQDRAVQTRVLAGGGAAGVEAALAELKPAAVLLHVGGSVDDGARAVDVVQRVAVLAPSLPLFVHREGSAPLDAPPSVALHRVRTLTGALHEILAVVR